MNGTTVETGDILAKNGVIHTVPSLLLPSGSLSLTAEKYLIALNCYRFVDLLRSVNLSHYVQLPSGEPSFNSDVPAFTILAPRDDAFEFDEWTNLPPKGSAALKGILEYHIVSGRWLNKDLEDGMLIGTELRGEDRKGRRQMLEVNVADHDGGKSKPSLLSRFGLGLGTQASKGHGTAVVGFGGASIIGEPVQVGDSIIYVLASILSPPNSLINTALSNLQLSTYVAAVYAASLDKILSHSPAITYLVPSNQAFTNLGLIMSYLLLPNSRDELRSLIRYHAIDEIAYLNDFPTSGSKRYPTLDGAEIYVERAHNGTTIHGPTIGGYPANGDYRDARIVDGNTLIATGVLHVIDQVELPPSLDITIAKLLRGAKANTFVDLIRSANMTWVLEGRGPPVIKPSPFSEGAEEVEAGENVEVMKRKQNKAKINLAYTGSSPLSSLSYRPS